MAAEHGRPVRPVVEADHDVAGLDQGAGLRLVLAGLGRGVVRRTVDVDGGVRLPVEEVGSGLVAGDGVLRIARQPKPQRLHHVEPVPFERAVATLPKRAQEFRTGARAVGGAALGS